MLWSIISHFIRQHEVFRVFISYGASIVAEWTGILQWILGDRSGSWMSFLTRHTLEEASSYSEAKKWLSNTKMLAPAYFIIGGNKTGQVSIWRYIRRLFILLNVWITCKRWTENRRNVSGVHDAVSCRLNFWYTLRFFCGNEWIMFYADFQWRLVRMCC